MRHTVHKKVGACTELVSPLFLSSALPASCFPPLRMTSNDLPAMNRIFDYALARSESYQIEPWVCLWLKSNLMITPKLYTRTGQEGNFKLPLNCPHCYNLILSCSKLKLNKSYRTYGIVKKKIESFSSRFSIFKDSMSSDCDLSHTLSPRNPRLVANHRLFAFDAQNGRRVR